MKHIDTSKYKNLQNAEIEKVPPEKNKKRFWIVAILTDLLLGVAGFTMVVFGFMYAVTLSNENNIQMMALFGIATAMLIVYFLIYACNRIIYGFFLRFSPLPRRYQTISMLIPWGVMGLMSLLMSLR